MDNPCSLGSSPSSYAENRCTSGPVESENAVAAINHLAPELLSKIFLICATLWSTDEIVDERGQNYFERADHLPWIGIAQVCRYWRSIALGCGELWRRLVFSSPEAASEMVRRSNGVPLIVQAESYDKGISENIRMVISDMRLLSVLHLSFPPPHLQHLLKALSATAPQLESLRLRTPRYTYKRDIMNFDFGDDYDLFNMPGFVHAPSLRLLELTRCNFSWHPLPQGGLTRLELRKISPLPTIAQLVSFLHALPMLNTLIIEEALPTPLPKDTSPPNPSPRHFLRNLHLLTLCGSVDACTGFLQRFCYPATTAVALKCDISSGSNPNFRKLLRATQSFGVGNRSIHSLSIFSRLECLVFTHPAPELSSSGIPELAIIMGGKHYTLRGVDASHLARSTVIVLPIAEVQILYLSGGLLGIDWPELLHHLKKIHTIHVRHVFPGKLIDALAGGVEQSMGSSRPTTVILPQLRSLWLTDVDFSGRTQRSFLEFLQFRAHAGSAIQELHIQNCLCLYEREVEMMKEFVQDVDWDGIEENDPYDDWGYNDYGGMDSSD